MGVRTWAALGNILQISAALAFLASAVIAYEAVELAQAQAPTRIILLTSFVAIVFLLFAVVFWRTRGALISGNRVARLLVGAYMFWWIVSTLGLGLLVIGIVYLFTSEPDVSRDDEGQRRPTRPRFKPPPNWRATGRVGPSGAMFYSDADQSANTGIFDSGVPVQVVDRKNGLADVVAATGERGWIDLRTLTEPA